MLLVHGNGGHAHWWDPLVPFLAPGWRLIAPDLRGHGESEWPAAPSYAIGDCAGDLVALLDALALDRVVIIAHSMGARIAVWLAAHHPDRVRGLALLDTSLGGVDEATARRWRGRVVGQREGRSYATREKARAAFRSCRPSPASHRRSRTDLAHHAIVERAPGEWAFRFDRAVLSLDGDGGGNLIDLAAGVPCPVWMGRGTGASSRRESRSRRCNNAAPTSKDTISKARIIFSCRTRGRQASRCGGSSTGCGKRMQHPWLATRTRRRFDPMAAHVEL